MNQSISQSLFDFLKWDLKKNGKTSFSLCRAHAWAGLVTTLKRTLPRAALQDLSFNWQLHLLNGKKERAAQTGVAHLPGHRLVGKLVTCIVLSANA